MANIFEEYYSKHSQYQELTPVWEQSVKDADSFKKQVTGSVFAEVAENAMKAENAAITNRKKLDELFDEMTELKKQIFAYFEANPGLKEVKIHRGANASVIALSPVHEKFEIMIANALN